MATGAEGRALRAPESELEAEQRRRDAAPAALGDVFSSMLDERASSAASRATRAWYAANGDIERAHTTGTFVREPRRGETGPVLVVYVDSKARATDFAANSEVYLARLANAGAPFSKVEFRLSRYPRRPQGSPAPAAARPRPGTEPSAPALAAELTARERAEIDEACSHLPERLRESVSRAMSASYLGQRGASERKS